MTTWFCPKTRVDCDKQLAAMQKEVADHKAWAGILQEWKRKSDAALAEANAIIDNHYAFMASGMPSMATMIADGRAVQFDTYEFQRQYTAQTGRVLSDNVNQADKKTKTLWSTAGYFNYRIPREVFLKIAAKSRVDRFKFVAPVINDPQVRPYLCNDFAWSFFGELQAGPWWDVFAGVVNITNLSHRLNIVWFSDAAELQLFEPQTDLVSQIDMAEREIVQVIT